MKTRVFYFTLLFCGLLMSSCQKEELISMPIDESQEGIDTRVNTSVAEFQNYESIVSDKKAACTKIHLFTGPITVSFEDFANIEQALLNSGISLVAPGCNVYYYQNSSIFPGWTQKVDDALTILSIGTNDVTFMIDNLVHVCYGCFFNSFCNYHNSTIHVALGNNGCLLGSFTLDVNNDQFVEIDLSSINNIKLCEALDCGGSGT